MNKFLKDLEKELSKLKVNKKDIKEILDDHEEMIQAAKNEGLNEEEIEQKFGNPQTVAKDIYEDTLIPKQREEMCFDDVNSCVKEDTSDFSLAKTFPVISKQLSIEIGLVSDDLCFTEYEGESIQVYMKDIKNLEEYTISYENDVFELKKNKTKIVLFSFSRKSTDFLVLVPKNAVIKDFEYQTVSGDAFLNGIISENIKIKSTSGDLGFKNLESKEMKISTVSGDIEMTRFKASSFQISLVSGDLEAEKGVVAETMYFHSVSGDIDLLEVECSEAIFKTVSGDLEGKEFYPNEITLKSVSGDITINNEDRSKEIIVIAKKSVSGDICIK